MKNINLIILVVIVINIHSQNYNYNWIGGYDSFNNDTIFNISFNKDSNLTKPIKSNMNFSFSNTTMSDSLGNLLYYSNGCRIFNRDHLLMQNGDGINYGDLRDELCGKNSAKFEFGIRADQSMLSLKNPYKVNEYKMLHIKYDYYSPTEGRVAITDLLESTIDMSKNNGLGVVTTKNRPIIIDTFSGNLVAVKHSNSLDWWIILPTSRKEFQKPISDSTNTFVKVLYKFDTAIVYRQNISDSLPLTFTNINITSNGKKIIYFVDTVGMYIYDFNRSTGLMSNTKKVKVPRSPTRINVSVVTSPNSRFVYCILYDAIYQYDLEAADIKASEIKVATFDGFRSNGYSTFFYNGQLGPDCRIYISSYNATSYYHYIKYPDRKGLTCEVVQHGLYFGDKLWNDFTIPYYPNYRIEQPYPCDSGLVMTITKLPISQSDDFTLYPNPVIIDIIIEFDLEKKGAFYITDIAGRVLISQKLHYQNKISMDVSTLITGMYLCTYVDAGGKRITKKFIKE